LPAYSTIRSQTVVTGVTAKASAAMPRPRAEWRGVDHTDAGPAMVDLDLRLLVRD
jgi:hypothetical protein